MEETGCSWRQWWSLTGTRLHFFATDSAKGTSWRMENWPQVTSPLSIMSETPNPFSTASNSLAARLSLANAKTASRSLYEGMTVAVFYHAEHPTRSIPLDCSMTKNRLSLAKPPNRKDEHLRTTRRISNFSCRAKPVFSQTWTI